MPIDEATLNSEEIKPVAILSSYTCLKASVRESVSQSVENLAKQKDLKFCKQLFGMG